MPFPQVDLESFCQPPSLPKKRESRFSHGEDRAPAEAFETGAIKKAASVAHVESMSRAKPASVRPDPSLMLGQFEGRLLLTLFCSCFTEDSYLKVSLTAQVLPPVPHRFLIPQSTLPLKTILKEKR